MKIRLAPIALLLTVSFAGSVEKFLPDQLLICLKQPLELRKVEGKYRSGNSDFDRLLQDSQVRSAEFPLKILDAGFPIADKILLLKFSKGKDLEGEIARFRTSPMVDWVIKHSIYGLDFIPDDSLFAQQTYLQQVNAPAGWDLAVGAETVILGIIDSGVDYTHPDLAGNIWLNPMEDNPVFGVLDSADYDGIDNDLNGFIDDLIGWDFVDTPELPYGIDFTIADNDPMDYFGHGTAVAGIAGALVGNNLGIAGTATNVKIMPLRVTSSGDLSEIALAQAVIYAVDPFPQNPTMTGAKVINLSLGSEQISPLMQDIIEFASAMDVIVVASAGNNNSTAPYYPAAFNTVLSVGALDSNNQKLNSSNYGPAIKITAPGQTIISTLLGGEYGLFQGGTGTSFSAPMVSGGVVMLRGIHPNWDAEQVKSAILSSATDLYSAGWDALTGQGMLNIGEALSIPYNLIAEISSPEFGSAFAGDTLNINGNAKGLYLKEYSLDWGVGNNPVTWNTILEGQNRQIIDSQLGKIVFDSTFADTVYTIKLKAEDQFGAVLEDLTVFEYISQPPTISNVKILTALEGNLYTAVVACSTNQLSSTSLLLTGQQLPQEFFYLYPNTNHIMTLNQNQVQGIFHLQVRALNLANLDTMTGYYFNAITLNQSPYNASYFDFKRDAVLPSGYLLPKTADFDGDGSIELFLQEYAYDSLKVFECDSGIFQALTFDYGMSFPQDLGDSNGDSLVELLCNTEGGFSIYEQSSIYSPPDSIIYSGPEGFFGLNLLDFTPSDTVGELFLRQDSVLVLYRHLNNGDLQLIDGIDTENSVTKVERCEWSDFNDDGNVEVIFVTDEGILSVFTLTEDSLFSELYQDTLNFPTGVFGGRFINKGDFDGDGIAEFIAGECSPTVPDVYGNNIGYWEFYIYDYFDTVGFFRAESLFFVGVSDPDLFPAGISVGNCDDDTSEEIFISVYPHLYLAEKVDTSYEVTWHYQTCRSNQTLIFDADNNGLPEIIFDRGESFASFEAPPGSNLPAPPANLLVIPQGPNVIKLYWTPVSVVDFYVISRGNSPDSLVDIGSARAIDSTYYDNNVTANSLYYYSVSTYANGQWSPRSIVVSGIPNSAPLLLYQTFILNNPYSLRLEFSESMSEEAEDRTRYTVSGNLAHPSSVVLEGDRSKALLVFNLPFNPNATYSLSLTPMRDLQGTNLVNTGPFNLLTPAFPQQLPYLVQADYVEGGILLEFSYYMNPDSASLVDRYSIAFGQGNYLTIDSVEVDTNDYRYVTLNISPDTPIGALGFLYTISSHDLYDIAGNPLDPLHSSVTLSFTSNDLNNVFVYPNPYRAGDLVDGEYCVVFANLMPNATVRIFNLSGELVKKLESGNNFGGVKWYLNNQSGELVGNGVYIYYVTAGSEKFTGKVAVLR